MPAHALGLTQRQAEVLQLLVQGKPNKLICRDLQLSEGTVKVHVSAILRRSTSTRARRRSSSWRAAASSVDALRRSALTRVVAARRASRPTLLARARADQVATLYERCAPHDAVDGARRRDPVRGDVGARRVAR